MLTVYRYTVSVYNQSLRPTQPRSRTHEMKAIVVIFNQECNN